MGRIYPYTVLYYVRINSCDTQTNYKLASPRKAWFYLATFFNITKRNVFCAPKNGWGMLVYAPGWSLPSQF